jgi:type IV pilus assembly protein PilM
MLGLDVGTSAVRVVELEIGDSGEHGSRPVIRVFGQVALPAGAVRDGEVVDPAAVGEAIAELWRETGLRQHDVRVGLASERVVVRVVEFPGMPDDELAGAVRFSAQDHISMPLDEAVFDFTILERFVPEDGGDAMVRVLLAAAHREPLERLLEAVVAGGLRAVAVDLVPFALVRALAGEPQEDSGRAPEAIVSVGAGVTTVVVHESGQPRFVRTVAIGGQALTAAVAEELDVSLEAAEAAKLAPGYDDLGYRAAQVVQSRLAGLLNEIQGSLDYWVAQSDRPLGRVLLTGGSALAGDLPDRLAALVGAPVEMALPRIRLDVDARPEVGPDLDPFLPVAAGLALGAIRTPIPRIDLNPTRPSSGPLSGRTRSLLAAGLGALLLLLGGVTVTRSMALSQEREHLSAQERTNQGIEAEIQPLGGARQASAQLDAGRQRVQAALAGDVAWSRILEDLAHSMPESVWLQTFNAQAVTSIAATPTPAPATPATAETATAPATQPLFGTLGSVSFTAVGLDFPSVASWLETVPQQSAFSALAVGSLTKAALGSGSTVSFSSTASLAPGARSGRAAHLAQASAE